MAERVGRRFSNYHVFGRDQVNTQTDQGPRPELKGGTAGLIEPLVQSRAAEAYARATVQNRATLGALTSTFESMTPVRGRKAIILFSRGFILDQELPLYRQVDDAARRANIAMYFVDARGLEVQSVFGSAEFGSTDRLTRCRRGECRCDAPGGGGCIARRCEWRVRDSEQERPCRQSSSHRRGIAGLLPAGLHAG